MSQTSRPVQPIAHYLVWGIALPAVAGLAIFMNLLAQEPGCACLQAEQQAKLMATTIMKAQQAHYAATQQFAKSLTELGLPPLKSDYFQNSIVLSDAVALSFATPYHSYFEASVGPIKWRKPLFKSYVIATTFDRAKQDWISIACVSKAPSDRQPAAPKFSQGQFVCPPDMTAI